MSTEHPADDHAVQPETDASARSVEIIPRPDAHVCIRHDCSETEDLAVVIPTHKEQRVLCPRHVDDYVGVKVR